MARPVTCSAQAMSTHRKPENLKVSPLVARLNARSDGRSFAFIYLTNECQLRCAHCSFQSGPKKNRTRINGGVLMGVLDELQGIRDISITGGEPTLHPDFRTVLHKAARQAQDVYMLSNGIGLIGMEGIRRAAKRNDHAGLAPRLHSVLDELPANVSILFPLDTFHINAFRPYAFFLEVLSAVARERYRLHRRPAVGFLSNEVTPEKSYELMHKFSVESCTHVGTALFAPWRQSGALREWYCTHPLNSRPFPGGIYINYKGVYLNEASLLVDLREGIETDLKIGAVTSPRGGYRRLESMCRRAGL